MHCGSGASTPPQVPPLLKSSLRPHFAAFRGSRHRSHVCVGGRRLAAVLDTLGFQTEVLFRSLDRAPAFFWKTFASSSFHLGSAGFIIVVLGASSSHTRFFELKASAPQLNGDHDEKHLKKDRLGRAVSD